MSKSRSITATNVDLEAAWLLLRTIVDFLMVRGVPTSFIQEAFSKPKRGMRRSRSRAAAFRSILKAYEEMGIVLSTWFTDPAFLDASGRPLTLHLGKGPNSFMSLMRASQVEISTNLAFELLSESPSVRLGANGQVTAVQRAFVLPNFEIPRAALIVERFLDTLHKNQTTEGGDIPLLLERCCYVTGVNAKNLAPLMRDIKSRGIAFMDSVDGEIESHRVRRSSVLAAGEMGVVTFAWTQRTGRSATGRRRRPKDRVR